MAHPDALPYPPPMPTPQRPAVPPINLYNINAAWIGVFWLGFEPLRKPV